MNRDLQNTEHLREQADQLVGGLAAALAASLDPDNPGRFGSILELFERCDLPGRFFDTLELDKCSAVQDITNEQQLVEDFRAGDDDWLSYIVAEEG